MQGITQVLLQQSADSLFSGIGYAMIALFFSVAADSTCQVSLIDMPASQFSEFVQIVNTCGTIECGNIEKFNRFFNSQPFSVFSTPDGIRADICQNLSSKVSQLVDDNTLTFETVRKDRILRNDLKETYMCACRSNNWLLPAIYVAGTISVAYLAHATYTIVVALILFLIVFYFVDFFLLTF